MARNKLGYAIKRLASNDISVMHGIFLVLIDDTGLWIDEEAVVHGI